MKQKEYIGKSIAVDMYNCDLEKIIDKKLAEDILAKGSQEYKFICEQIILTEEPEEEEYSLTAIGKHGHVILHVFPSKGFMTVHIFNCHESADGVSLAKFLRLAFNADKSKITVLDRGDFGGKNDMKPSRSSKIKLIRRTKNMTSDVSAKIKRIMMKPRGI